MLLLYLSLKEQNKINKYNFSGECSMKFNQAKLEMVTRTAAPRE